MKHVLAVTLLGLALVACPCRTVPLLADSAEPNDTPAQATPLVGGFLGSMNEGDAPDVFKFSAVANQQVHLQLSELPHENTGFLDLEVTVRAPDTSLVLNRRGVLYEPMAALEFSAPATGEYILNIEGFYVGPADALCLVGRLQYQLSVNLTGP